MTKKRGIRICIDRGGTFTDCIGFVPDENEPSGYRHIVLKLLSVDPAYPDAPREGIRRILELATGKPHPRDVPVDTSNIESIRMGTTVATNALLERNGEPCALVITKGFKDLLHIGTQSRPAIFDLKVRVPDVLFREVLEVDERVTLVGYSCSPLGKSDGRPKHDGTFVQGVTNEWVHVLKAPEVDVVRKDLQDVFDRGIRSLAIVFMHAYTFPEHERTVAALAKEIGFDNVTLSSAISPMIKIVPRGTSSTVDAYLTPPIHQYIKGFFSGFDEGISDPTKVRIEFMQSDGGLTSVRDFSGFKAILSGPAGGVVGYARTSYDDLEGSPVIGFDMGGTSTDVSRYAGCYEHVFETTTAGVLIQAPQLDISTVAAGGGSRLFFRDGIFVVGPESASAHPGPACYRKGGPLAVTDANLFLGRLIPEFFPKIFGPSENEPLDIEATKTRFSELSLEVNAFRKQNGLAEATLDEVAHGFISVATEAMCRPIRALTQAKGYGTSAHVLACFGGAGAQHACAVAKSLGIKRILINRYAAILSAYGLSLADVVHEEQEPSQTLFSVERLSHIQARCAALVQKCFTKLEQAGFNGKEVEVQVFLHMRYTDTDNSLMILKPKNSWAFDDAFIKQYNTEFGFTLNRPIIVDDIRVRGIGRELLTQPASVYDCLAHVTLHVATEPTTVSSVYWERLGRVDTPVFELSKLSPGHVVEGPAIVLEPNSSIVVESGCRAIVTDNMVVIEVGEQEKEAFDTRLDPVRLSIFSHRFMSIAEQMGHTLQRTSVSTNMKERLDFSCALFGADGGLVSNAPHIPVHLGSMQEAVKYQINFWGDNLSEGDVLVSNHPKAGGSHLPDITVITPVFESGKVVFFTASRGHHADIGGLEPGSLPPFSKELFQEGAAIRSFKLVENGQFQEAGIVKLLVEEPAKNPGCSGTRTLKDNLSDLKAQVSANQRGINLVKALISEYGLEVVQSYMAYIRQNAELAVRNLLVDVYSKHGGLLIADDSMDDGSPIKLTVKIDPESRSAIFDFTGTGQEVYGNMNAPRAITYSATLYCLRALVAKDIPLNQGCLAPITFIIPPGSILDPSESAAVVGGNVLTSQRLVDVILRAFSACAASQGCMNNLTFGTQESVVGLGNGWGYYETIAGGAGAGPTWHGRSGVHTHMTNTRITDPEILERRYPVLLREFGLRASSGGQGRYSGGDGVVRDIKFLEPVQVSILSERRVVAPYGLEGGENGKCGRNTWIRKNGATEQWRNLGGKNTILVEKGDRLRIETPGGGGKSCCFFASSFSVLTNVYPGYGTLSTAPEGGEKSGTSIQPAKAGGSLLQRVVMQNSA
ncbi:hypothetical protein M427DRAFT_105271 [Gonapodya prolifera JEL478]|uniref:5-oxoprolinase n=1 Tax=Gonapodya prolifera (strain JEL478) TaxID=1344416 RepID=A0A138ZYB1_GONPJ|nr:hypothetical protein M427DRAFT_105271 [Gonapodya prolifera JEL478]|eukprot:KXS09479.1 hypothetical protein M427DRAFT_105271 [Gonapodya prolifera JEL478]